MPLIFDYVLNTFVLIYSVFRTWNRGFWTLSNDSKTFHVYQTNFTDKQDKLIFITLFLKLVLLNKLIFYNLNRTSLINSIHMILWTIKELNKNNLLRDKEKIYTLVCYAWLYVSFHFLKLNIRTVMCLKIVTLKKQNVNIANLLFFLFSKKSLCMR